MYLWVLRQRVSTQLSNWHFFFFFFFKSKVALSAFTFSAVLCLCCCLLNKTSLNFKNFVLGLETLYRLSQNHCLVWDISRHMWGVKFWLSVCICELLVTSSVIENGVMCTRTVLCLAYEQWTVSFKYSNVLGSVI